MLSKTGDLKNLIGLEEFTEGAIIHQCRKRYKQDKIYTYIGNILVSINPFKQLPIYVLKVLNAYKDIKKIPNLEPHVFGVASLAYAQLINEKIDQSVVISGESGSGKTEATKLVLQYLSEVAGSDSGVEQQIMLSNPILEGFGNAKTLRNNNSSRFGKWMEIIFSSAGKIVGAKIVNYLLEKSRVVGQTKDERNYHIFFQVCAGCPAEYREKYCIFNADHFEFLQNSGCTKIPGVEDGTDFEATLNAMEKLQFSKSEQEGIISILALLLHMGNLKFEAPAGDSEGSFISNKDQVELTSKLIGLMPEVLHDNLCFRFVVIRGETQKIKLKVFQAIEARDSLVKTIYGNLFDWLVYKINMFLCRTEASLTIGVLDIFGFEVFEKNSFEQFCINYANEQLQAHFNEYIFTMEQAEYKAEDISLQKIDFVDNSECLEMIADIIGMIDEEVMLPKATDIGLIEKLNKKMGDPKAPRKSYAIKKQIPENFIIKHYAGDVSYNIMSFLDKNRDSISESLQTTVKSCTNEIVLTLFNFIATLETDGSAGKVGTLRIRTPSSPSKSKGPKTLSSKVSVFHVSASYLSVQRPAICINGYITFKESKFHSLC
jgi:myosin-7